MIVNLNYNTKICNKEHIMGDTWKSITVEGVNAFVNSVFATVLIWVAIESPLSTYLGLPKILILATAIIASILVVKKKSGSFNPIEKRAAIQGMATTLIVWFSTMGYLNFIPETLIQIGIFSNLAYSLLVGSVIFFLFITIFHGLHGKYFTTLMLEHMPWVIKPDKFLFFFWFWINLITAGLLNIFEVNMWWYFVDLFFYALFPSLFLGVNVHVFHGSHIKSKDDYFD